MQFVLIDSALLAIPNYAVSSNDALSLFDRIIHFADVLISFDIPKVVVSDQLEDDLWTNSCGPDFHEISAFLALVNLSDVFAPNDLMKSYQTILSRAVRLSQVAPFEVSEFDNFTSAPQLPHGLGPACLRHGTERTFVNVASLGRTTDGWWVGSGLADAREPDLYDVSATLLGVGGLRADLIGPLPALITAHVRSMRTCDELVSHDHAVRIWRSASDEFDMHLAITVAASCVLRSAGLASDVRDLMSFSIGTAFGDSVRANQCAGTGRFANTTLERCAQIVAQAPNVVIGNLGKPQFVRPSDGWRARRVHLTGGGAALRLMFWQGESGIEFANVGVKHELAIAAGHPANAIKAEFSASRDA